MALLLLRLLPLLVVALCLTGSVGAEHQITQRSNPAGGVPGAECRKEDYPVPLCPETWTTVSSWNGAMATWGATTCITHTMCKSPEPGFPTAAEALSKTQSARASAILSSTWATKRQKEVQKTLDRIAEGIRYEASMLRRRLVYDAPDDCDTCLPIDHGKDVEDVLVGYGYRTEVQCDHHSASPSKLHCRIDISW